MASPVLAEGEPEAVAPVPPQPGEPGWLLGGRYRVIDRIGAGGMAEVFRAHDQLLARDVAVKVFRAHSDLDDVTAGVQRQELELQTLARLSHPNLITLFDGSIGSDGEPAFLVMELINGPSLAARIAQAPLTEPEAREIATQIAGALAYVHSQHMVHRDIKPANILLGADGTTGDTTVGTLRARLSDFGIVRLLGSEHLTSADFMIGTASYLAPEQARGAEVGPAADVYALGLVLIEAMTGRRSYEGPALEAVLARLDRSPEIPAGLAQPWPGLLQAMTAMDSQFRPSAAEVARTLREGVAVPAPMLAAAGDAVLAGDAVPAGGAPLAAASGLTGTTALAGSALAGGTVADAAVPSATAAGPAAADPELATAFIAADLPPMPPPVDHEPEPLAEPERRSGSRGPLIGAAVAAAALITALTAGGLMLVNQPSTKNPSMLPGQAVSSPTGLQPVAKPTPSRTSVAPIGAIPSSATGGTFAGGSRSASSTASRSSGPARSSAPASSSSAAPSSSAPSSSSAASSSTSASSSASSTTSTSTSPSASSSATSTATGSTTPAVATSPTTAPSKPKHKKKG